MSDDLLAQLARIWRRRYLVAAVAALSVAAALASVLTTRTTYTSTAALITASPNRSPEQDGILARGYVDFFVEPSMQGTLRKRAEVPEDVTLTARTAASSPIIYISATSTDGSAVRSAAARVAEEFRLQVNSSLRTAVDRTIAEMRKPVDDAQRTTGTVPQVVMIQLQDRINAVNADASNKLEILKVDGAVTASAPAASRIVGVGLLGGLFLGCALAWLLGAVSRRVSAPYDLVDKAGIDPLVQIPGHDRPSLEPLRERQLRQLAATVASVGSPEPAVIAFVPMQASAVADEIVRAVVEYRAAQGVRTVLVHADPDSPACRADRVGEVVLDGRFVLTGLAGDPVREVFPALLGGHQRAVFGAEPLGRLATALRDSCDLVVVQSPPAEAFAESQAVSTAADRTVLVIEEGSAVGTLVAARERLERSGVAVLGVVYAGSPRRRRGLGLRRDRRASGSWARVLPAPAEESRRDGEPRDVPAATGTRPVTSSTSG